MNHSLIYILKIKKNRDSLSVCMLIDHHQNYFLYVYSLAWESNHKMVRSFPERSVSCTFYHQVMLTDSKKYFILQNNTKQNINKKINKLYNIMLLILQLFLIIISIVRNHEVIVSKMPNQQEYMFAIDMKLLESKNTKKFNKTLKALHLKHNLKDTDFNLNNFGGSYESENQAKQDLKHLNLTKNYCLGNRKFKTQDQKLKHFKEGPCSPVLLVPGILGTSLVVEIDCNQMISTAQGKKIFEKCGWNTCNGLLGGSPARHYMLWVGINFMSKGFLKSERKDCLGQLLGLRYNQTDPIKNNFDRYYEPKGVRSTWFGNNQYTYKKSDCGENAISDLAGSISVLKALASQCAIKGYRRLISIMKQMGYVSGITMQPIPYDFRYSINSGMTQYIIPQVVNNLYYTTGKAVVMIGHSLGTLHLLNALAFNMSSQVKDKMVREFIPIAPPFFGVVSSIRNLISGDETYWNKMNIGVSFQSQAHLLRTAGGVADLIIRDGFLRYRNQSWLQDILQRIKYQQTTGNENLTEYPLSWYPGKNQTCFNWHDKADPLCKMGFIDYQTTPMMKINESSYYANIQNITQIFKIAFYPQTGEKIFKIWNTTITNNSLYNIPEPGVNTSVIFSTFFPTPNYFEYKNYTRKMSKNEGGSFLNPNITKFSDGDGTVPSYSPLFFITKWIAGGNNNKTVKAVEYCANYKGQKKEHYESIECTCLQDRLARYADCQHACIISEINTIKFLVKKFTNEGRGYVEHGLSSAIRFTSTELELRNKQCPNLQRFNIINPSTVNTIHLRHHYKFN